MRNYKAVPAILVAMLASSCASAAEPGHRPALRILAYPVNRVLDLTDVVSFSLGVYSGDPAHLRKDGQWTWAALAFPGFGLGVHATRALQVEFLTVYGLEAGWWPGRQLGVGNRRETLFALGPCSVGDVEWTRWGTAGPTHAEWCWGEWAGGDPADVIFDTPTDPRHQDSGDYWGIGLSVYCIAGMSLELHPTEVADLFAGLLFVDFMWDDIGHTR
jgi:hypothetical protein